MDNIKKHNRETGTAGENLAAAYLESRGYIILQQNYKCKAGEIDIIARKDGELFFIEVKTRCSTRFGTGAEAIDEKKLSHIRNCADYYMKSVNWKGNAKICPIIINLNYMELDWSDISCC